MHVERRGGHWRGALELVLGRGHALCEPVDRKGSALYGVASRLPFSPWLVAGPGAAKRLGNE